MRSPPWTWDEVVLACALVAANGWHELRRGDRRVTELSHVLRLMPLHPPETRGPDFRSENSVSRKTTDIATRHPAYQGQPTRGGRTDLEVIDAFLKLPTEMHAAAELIRSGVTSGELRELVEPVEDGDGSTALEGRLLQRRHLVRERDPRLRKRKIDSVIRASGALSCEVCAFNFARTYGGHGVGYIEVHHVVPLHVSGVRETRLEDLAVLCANCHRMSHRRLPEGSWPTPDGLRTLLNLAGHSWIVGRAHR
jgi:5-methylcytosine-specific restriction protein A